MQDLYFWRLLTFARGETAYTGISGSIPEVKIIDLKCVASIIKIESYPN